MIIDDSTAMMLDISVKIELNSILINDRICIVSNIGAVIDISNVFNMSIDSLANCDSDVPIS